VDGESSRPTPREIAADPEGTPMGHSLTSWLMIEEAESMSEPPADL